MTAITAETVEILTASGVTRVDARRYLDFAVHRSTPSDLLSTWSITHLPTGMSVGRKFHSEFDAHAAMIEISRLRNDWAVISDGDFSDDLKGSVVEIVERHGGVLTRRTHQLPRRPELNGYRP